MHCLIEVPTLYHSFTLSKPSFLLETLYKHVQLTVNSMLQNRMLLIVFFSSPVQGYLQICICKTLGADAS